MHDFNRSKAKQENQKEQLSEMKHCPPVKALEECLEPLDAFLRPWEPNSGSNQFGKTCQHQEVRWWWGGGDDEVMECWVNGS